jgi:hypothetical protein
MDLNELFTGVPIQHVPRLDIGQRAPGSRFYIGLDLGQARDYTAASCIVGTWNAIHLVQPTRKLSSACASLCVFCLPAAILWLTLPAWVGQFAICWMKLVLSIRQ